ncbi:MAG: sodium:solute symporter family protein [Armatimonadota bacterium]|nr:Na+:solute symporter [Armatimonadota bacterium]MCX7776764.1 Na+:solute symporter [Armatimonadota bacterium]MDW8024561.1 sodium:solute symporter family protein [Armatimonadota bacterium]
MDGKMALWDYAIVGLYFAFALGVGGALARRAAQSIAQYFAAGRELPWWLAGTSMVATTFASDTPLAVTGFIRKQGIVGNWFWWNAAIANMLSTFLFAPLWRRSGALTDLEFIAMRYSGTPANILRGFRVLYTSLIANSIVMGWVIHAMVKIVRTTFGWEPITALAILISVAFAYTITAGLWGVVLTDFLQFALAMTGAIWLAFASLEVIGGGANLVSQLKDAGLAKRLLFLPSCEERHLWIAFLTYILVQWWAVGRPDGEGYIAQRMLATKDERNAVLSVLWFSFAHYVLRPWWWIVVALASLLLMPNMPKEVGDEGAYPAMMIKLLPTGALGIMVAAMLAAFMSTMDTHMNWAASYLVNDFYKPFIKSDADEKHYVLIGRLATAFILALGVGASLATQQISTAWMLLAGLNAGIGLVSMLRWLWWRINAWSEISAMATALIVNSIIYILGWCKLAPFDFFITDLGFPYRLIIIIVCVQVAWVAVTLLTKPEPMEKLVSFYRKVRPPGWWRTVSEAASLPPRPIEWYWVLGWVGGVMLIYGGLIALGGLLLSQLKWLLIGAVPTAIGCVAVARALRRCLSSHE